MKFLIFLLIILVCIFLLINYFTNQQDILRHQIIVLQRHNYTLKKELSKYKVNKDLSIEFIVPTDTIGIIAEKTRVFLCPIEDSILVHCSAEKMQVKILDECIINDMNWYYITLPLENNVNCRGWVKKNNFSMLCGEISDLQ